MSQIAIVGWVPHETEQAWHPAGYVPMLTGIPTVSLPAVVEALSDALTGSPVIRHRNLLKLLHELRALKESA